jgi:hypothetical protein
MKKVKLTPKQLILIISLNDLKRNPIKISGKSAKLLHQYLADNNIKLADLIST